MITNQDLLNEISQAQLVELSDLNGTGEIDQGVVDDALNDAISLIESYIVLPEAPTKLLKKITADLTIFELKQRNGFLSDDDKTTKKECEGYLTKMSNGKLITEDRNSTTRTTQKVNKSFAFVHHKKERVNFGGYR